MGCGCGKARRAIGGMTSAEGQPLTPQESAANAIANAGGFSYNAPGGAVETVDNSVSSYAGDNDNE